jgi:hypothetical protein
MHHKSMFYVLWDVESGNSLGDFDSESEALLVVRDLLDANESDYVEALSLGRTDDSGRTIVVADGANLAARARIDLDTAR